MSKWRRTTLEELAHFQRGFDISKAEQQPGNVPVVSSSGVTSYHSVAKVKGPGVTIGRKGTLGTVFYVPQDYWPHSTSLWVTDFKGNEPKFVYYFLKTLGLEQYDVGASNPTLNRNHIHGLPITIPDVKTQRRIADILSAYDDLIENNRRRIVLLEETARLAYRKWFGGAEQGRTATLGEVCQTYGGGTPKTGIAEYWDGDIPWVVPTDITRNTSLALLKTERRITELGFRKSAAKMLPANAILMTSRASVGFFGMADFPVCTNQGFIGIVPNDESFRWYLLFNLLSRVEEIRSNAKGSTFPEISRSRFRDMTISIPDNDSIDHFNVAVTPLMQQVHALSKQNRVLATARDMLLPRLMKGDVG
jgi:type I restriction enzyme S subunit